jgi:hypothetical protein
MTTTHDIGAPATVDAETTAGRVNFRITGTLDVVDVVLYRLRDAFSTVDVGDVTPLTGNGPAMVRVTAGVTL